MSARAWRGRRTGQWPAELKAAKRAASRSASAEATKLGHDMYLRADGGPGIGRWECRRCGRIAYQGGDVINGSATVTACVAAL